MKLETVGSNSDIKNQMTIDGMYIYLESKIGVRKNEGYGNNERNGRDEILVPILYSIVKELNIYILAIVSWWAVWFTDPDLWLDHVTCFGQ